MPRRNRRAMRPILLHLPTRDGHKIHVRSQTVAERLMGQAHLIERLSELGRETGQRLEWADERFRRLRGHPLVRLLCWLRIVRPAAEQRPEGWEAPVPVSPAKARLEKPEVPAATPPSGAPPAQNGRWVP